MRWHKPQREQDLQAELTFFDRLLKADYPFGRGVYAGLAETEYLEVFSRYLGRNGPYALALDIGSGVGLSSLLLGRYADGVCSMDLSIVGFNRLTEIVRPGEKAPWLVGGDAVSAPFMARTFDVIFACGLLHHIPNWPVCLKRIVRLLAPGGHLVLVEPNLLNLAQTVNFIIGVRKGNQSPNEFPLRRGKVIRQSLRHFHVVESEYLLFNHQVKRLSEITEPAAWDRIQRLYYRIAPRPFWSQFFVVSCQHQK